MPDSSIPLADPTTVTGLRYTDDSSHKVVREMANTILRVFPSATPLIVLKGKTRQRRVVNYYKFEWMEVTKQPREMRVTAASAAGSGTVVVATADYPKAAKNYVFMNTRTREQVLITEDPSSGTLADVVRVIGGGGAPMDVGDVLEFQAPIHPDADTLGTIKSIKEDVLENYVEIIRTPMGWSGRNAKTSYYGGRDPKELRMRAALEHRISIEKRGFFGKKHSRTISGNQIQTFTGGGEWFIKSHVWDLAGAALTERSLVEWMESVMANGDGGYINGNGVKWAISGNSPMTEIEFFARDKLRYEPLSSKIGMKAASFHSTHGQLNIIRHPQFTGIHAGYLFVADMNHIQYVCYDGRDTALLENRQANDLDGVKHEFMTDCGWAWMNQSSHGLIKGHRITAA